MVRRYKRISDYGVIGDMHSAALVGVDGSIDWCCFPRFDSPSVFAALLDADKGGKFQLVPTEEYVTKQYYEKDTNVLNTVFKTAEGSVKLTDFMPCLMHKGELTTFQEIIRVVQQTKGATRMKADYEPRLNYAIGKTRLERIRGGYKARNQSCTMLMLSNILLKLAEDKHSAVGEFTMSEGEKALFVVRFGKEPPRLSESMIQSKLSRTIEYWQYWALHIKFEGRWRDEVVRSALVLKLLQYSPTGAIVAAPTTSLPEGVGGERNWDYRYSWIRDAAFTLWALDSIGATREAMDYARWLIEMVRKSKRNDLQIMMSVTGELKLKERTLRHLEGYRGSRPVRIGNAAHTQLQLDVYGALIDSMYFLHKVLGWTTKKIYLYLVREPANFVASSWHKPDSGMWEMRTRPRFFVESRIWCYVALDRAIRLADELGFDADAQKWGPIKEQIKREVISKGWSEKKQAFSLEYGSDELDAANLLIPLLYFLPAKDPKVASTVRRIREELSCDDLVCRYKTDDGLKGNEGAFTVCSFWLIDCMVRMGEVKQAKKLLEKLLRRANHLGLYSEEIDPETGEALGNFPQAYTHMGLISAILHLDKAMSTHGEKSRPERT